MKIRKLILGLVITSASLFSFTERVHADEPTFNADDKGTVTIKYFDDEEDTIPVTGAEFKIYKVATIGNSLQENGKYIPIIAGFDFTNEKDAYAYEEKVVDSYKNTYAPEYYTDTTVIGKDGLGVMKNVPAGAYLVTETKTVRYHIRSIPFLISVPETNTTQTGWNFNVVAEPKATVAGDVTFKKVLSGNNTDPDDVFQFKINIGDLERTIHFEGNKLDGKTVKTGDIIEIKGGQSFTIEDIPEGTQCSVEEVNGDDLGYVVRYDNNNAKVQGKTSIDITVTNTKESIPTGVRNALYLMMIFGFTLALLVIVLVVKRREKKQDNENEKG